MILTVAVLIVLTVVRRPAPRIRFTGFTNTQIDFAAKFVRELDADFVRNDTEFLTEDGTADLVIAPLGRGVTAEPSELAPLPAENFGLLPSPFAPSGE